jgi:integrase
MTPLETDVTILGSVGRGERADGKDTPMARRRYQNGYITKRGSNWVLRYREDMIQSDGSLGRVERTRILLPATASKKEARREADRFVARLNSGQARPSISITFDDFWLKHFESCVLPNLKVATQRLYRSLVETHLRPAFALRRLSEITRLDVQQFIVAKQQLGYSPKTLSHLRNLLSKIFGTAIRWDWLSVNPARELDMPTVRRTRPIRVLSPEEVRKLAAGLKEPARTVFAMGVLLGLRIGEILALQAGDVELLGERLFVRRNVYRGHVQDAPKTERSERSLPIPKPLAPLLTALCRGRVADAWVFPSSAGSPYDDRNLMRRDVEPVCKRLGIPPFGWHALRHTFSTYTGNSGTPTAVLQSLLGHTSADMSMRYTHPLESSQREAIDRVAGILWPNVAWRRGRSHKAKELIH